MTISTDIHPRLFFSVLFIGMLLVGFFIVKPYMIAILTAIILSVLSYPIHCWFQKFVRRRWIAAFLTTTLVLFLILVPATLILGALAQEALAIYQETNQGSIKATIENALCKRPDSSICVWYNETASFIPGLTDYLEDGVERALLAVSSAFQDALLAIPSVSLSFFIMLFLLYYFLKDHYTLIDRLNNIIPIKQQHKVRIAQRFKRVTFAAIYGNVFVAFIQGVVAGIGYMLLGVDSPLLWTALTAFFALLPYIGTAIIWVPLSFDFLINGYLGDDSTLFIKGFILFLYGFVIISSIDNVLKPIMIGKTGKVHPIIALLGVFGGLELFGLIGIILGPVLLAVLMTIIELYEKERGIVMEY